MKTILRTTWRLHLISMSRTPELSEVQKQVGIAIDLLTKEALPSGAKPLRKATDFCSIDAGEYRIVYSRPRGQEIYIMRIQHRDTVYKNLKRLQPPA